MFAFLIWFSTTFFLAPLALSFSIPENHRVETIQKLLVTCILILIEFYVVMSNGMRGIYAIPALFVGALIFGPIICRIPFREGAKFAAIFTAAKVIVYLVIAFFYG